MSFIQEIVLRIFVSIFILILGLFLIPVAAILALLVLLGFGDISK